MTDTAVSMELMHELLKDVRGALARLEDGQRTTIRRLNAIETHLSGFHATIAGHSDDLDIVRMRLERIEKRLDLTDA